MPKKPMDFEEDDSVPEMEHLLVQNNEHNKEMMDTLDHMVAQNEENNPNPLLEHQLQVQSEILKEIKETRKTLEEKKEEDLDFTIQSTAIWKGKEAHNYHMLGSRDNGWTSTSALGDACQYLDTSQALMNTPTAGQTLYIVSTSASDTSAGTGAQTVRYIYLDSNGDQQVGTATMNGTTAVSLGTGFTFIQWMEVATVGINEVSVGNISITSTNGAATVATTFEYIKAGGNRSLSGRYKVPTGFTGYVHDWSAAAISNTMDTRLRINTFADDNAISDGAYHFKARVFLASGANAQEDLHHIKCPEGTIIKISAIPGAAAAGNKLDCHFDISIIAN